MTTHRSNYQPADLESPFGGTPDWRDIPNATPAQQEAARHVIEDLAHDPQDAADLMRMLGIEGAK